MSVDITIEATPDTTLSFDDFASEHLPLVARAIQVVAPSPERADVALASGAASAFATWTLQLDVERAQQQVFASAVRTLRDHPDTEHNEASEIASRAAAVAHHVFGWDPVAITSVVGLAEHDLAAAREAEGTGDELRALVAEAEPAHVDLLAITHRHRVSTRRRIARVALGAIAALLVLGALAQFVARPERAEPAQGQLDGNEPAQNDPAENDPARTEPGAEAAPLVRAPFPGENATLTDWVPPQERLPDPSLITSGGVDGFVGVRRPAAPDTEALIVTSRSGRTWERAGVVDIGPVATIDRIERIGNHFAIWFQATNGRGDLGSQLAVSDDLANWSIVDLQAELQPFGLIYNSQITDVSAQDDVVLALVTTEVAIDFAALSLSEGYTCGHSITDNAVTVNLCNAELDVLSFSDVEQLPARNRLFVSRNGEPFEPTPEPFGRGTEAQLGLAGESFAIADGTGLRFATSLDAQTWQAAAVQKPPFSVDMSVANNSGHVLGAGTGVNGETMLFFNNGPRTTSTQLDRIIGGVSADVMVLLTSTPTRWALYVHEPDGRAWIAASADGLSWNVADAPAPGGTAVRLVASDSDALVQVVSINGAVSNMAVPLP